MAQAILEAVCLPGIYESNKTKNGTTGNKQKHIENHRVNRQLLFPQDYVDPLIKRTLPYIYIYKYTHIYIYIYIYICGCPINCVLILLRKKSDPEARGTRLGRVPRGTGPRDTYDTLTPLAEAELGKY